MIKNKSFIQSLLFRSPSKESVLYLGSLLFIVGMVGIWISCSNQNPPLFELLEEDHTGIYFKNEIIENDTHNILNFTNLYTGAGVGIGDFNNDDLPDLFFGSNMESSQLYLNKGNLQFENITTSAHVETDRWIMGVAVVDINADGWDDVYLSVSGNATSEKRKNLLFINQQDNTFLEQAENYGIADTSQCTHANFFDYDKDGDLDLFLIVNPTDYTLYNINSIKKRKLNGEAASTDILYQNNGDGTFTNVSRAAGILIEGYSLSLNVSDLNNDGWSDIYVTNDFLTNDILYINNQDGTFTNRSSEMLKHTSFASMGVDVADINNDGLPEIYVLDMFPEDNYRQKMIMSGSNYDRFKYTLKAGYEPQYSRNTLQLNNGDNTFSEIGQLANIHKTDWSWSALLADYDNDGYRDLFVTNGFRRDLGDLDYINYNNQSSFGTPETRKAEQLERIINQSGAKLKNYIFRNEQNFQFSNQIQNWGFDIETYSHGAAFADLDQDGDLDLVINNVAQNAMIYENKSNELNDHHFLKIKLNGTPDNPHAFGTKIWLHYKDQVQFVEQTPYRGYESSVDPILHFGLGKVKKVDYIEIEWMDGSKQKIEEVKIDTTITINYNQQENRFPNQPSFNNNPIFETITIEGLNFVHKEDDQVDFKTQSLLPHQHSMQGACMAVADINGDQLDDLFIGGASGQLGSLFIQNKDGGFTKKAFNFNKKAEQIDAVFFDYDLDGDQDLYVANGGIVRSISDSIYQDQIFINDGSGNFKLAENILPYMPTSTGCVQITDIDQDGDQDIFVGSQVVPNQYPRIPESYFLKNENGIFKKQNLPNLASVGMVQDALWTDIDGDNDKDLMVAGEFMPITFFENIDNQLSDTRIVIPNSSGWWNTLASGDFDNDGDIDYLAGNLGLNTNYNASVEEPFRIYAKDFDKNGSIDPIMTQYIDGIEYPIPSRDNLILQIPPIKIRFNNYKKYANANFKSVIKKAERQGAQILEVQIFESVYIENQGNKKFVMKPLPVEMQLAPIQSFLIEDMNKDGYLDAIAVGNAYATEVGIGRYDASTGAALINNGGEFLVLRGADFGMIADKDARQLVHILSKEKGDLYIVANNSDSLQTFLKTTSTEIISLYE